MSRKLPFNAHLDRRKNKFFTNKDLASLKTRIAKVYHDVLKGKIGNLEDCQGFVLISLLTNPKQRIGQAIIDYARYEVGIRDQKNSNTNELRAEMKKNFYFAKTFDPLTDENAMTPDFNQNILVEQIGQAIGDPYLRGVFFLRFKWGFQLDEIAEVFGVTESLISRNLVSIVTKLISKKTFFDSEQLAAN